MNDVTIFFHETLGELRVVDSDGEPWFVAKDVCDILGTRTDSIRSILDPDEVAIVDPNTIGVGKNSGKQRKTLGFQGRHKVYTPD